MLCRILLNLLVFVCAVPALAQVPYVYHALDIADSTGSQAYHINNLGQIAGSTDGLDGVTRGFVLDPDGTLDLFDGADGTSPYSETWAVNSSGQSAVYDSNADFSQFDAYRREADGTLVPANFTATPDPSNFAIDINESGTLLVQGPGLSYTQVTDGTQQVIETPRYSTDAAWGINDDGIVVGVAWPGFFDTNNGFIYDTNDSSFDIWNFPGAMETSLYDINNHGDMVGWMLTGVGSPEQAFLRHADGTTQFLDYPGAVSTRVWGINDSGVLTGRYRDSDGVSHAFVATPVPEPTVGILLSTGLVLIGGFGRLGRKSRPQANFPRRFGALRAALPVVCGVVLVGTLSSRASAQHSDISITIDDGQLAAEDMVYSGDIREFDLHGDGTVWRTSNPGYATSGFGVLNNMDEVAFDFTSPLYFWSGGVWSIATDDQYLREFAPPPTATVTATGNTGHQEGFLIQRAGTLGSIHQHFTFELGTLSGGTPDIGAYAIQQVLHSPQYLTSDPFFIIFNNGLEPNTFANAVADARVARSRAGDAFALRT